MSSQVFDLGKYAVAVGTLSSGGIVISHGGMGCKWEKQLKGGEAAEMHGYSGWG